MPVYFPIHESPLAVFGLGMQEILIFLVMLGVFVAALVIVIIAVLAMQKKSKQGNAQGNPNLVACVDCGGAVSRLAESCPHCGRPS